MNISFCMSVLYITVNVQLHLKKLNDNIFIHCYCLINYLN